MVIARVTFVAAAKELLPAWLAFTLQVPSALKLKVLPLMAQTEAVEVL